MTTNYAPADQRVTEENGTVLLELDVDAGQPANDDWHVTLLAPVKADAGQGFSCRVNWRGAQAQP
jgi:hypothetical protein